MKQLKLILCILLIFVFFGCSKDPIGYLEEGKKDFNAGRYLAAIDNLRHAKYFLPNNFEATLYLGKAFLNHEEDRDANYKARYYLKRASELARTNEENLYIKIDLLALYKEKKRYKEIVKTCTELRENYKPLLKNKLEFEINNTLAEAYFQTEEYEKSSGLYNSILHKHKNILDNNSEFRSMTLLRLGTAEIISDDKNIKKAISHICELDNCDYSSFARHNISSAAACYSLTAEKLYENKEYENAIKYYDKSKELFVLINDRNQIKRISDNLDKAYDKHDKNCDTYPCIMRRGIKQMDEKDFDDAAKEFKKAAEVGKTRQEKAEALLKMGTSLFLDDKFEDALAELKKVDCEYQKDLSDLAHLHLYHGAALILSADKPDSFDKVFSLYNKYKNHSDDRSYRNKGIAFKEQISNGENKIRLSFKVFDEENDDKFREEFAEICSKVADKFRKWEMITEAKDFYENSKNNFQYIENKERADKVQEELDSLNS